MVVTVLLGNNCIGIPSGIKIPKESTIYVWLSITNEYWLTSGSIILIDSVDLLSLHIGLCAL